MKHWLKPLLFFLLVVSLVVCSVPYAGAAPQKASTINANYATNVKNYGAKGDRATDDYAALQTAIAAAKEKSGEGSLYFPAGTYRVSKMITFDSSLELIFEEGAKLLLEKNASISSYIVAGNYQIFEGGTVVGTPTNEAGNPVWFGAKGDGVTNDTEAFKMALKLYRTVNVPYSEAGYLVSELTLEEGSCLAGPSFDKKAKLIAMAKTGSLLTVNSNRVYITNLTLEMSASKYGTAVFFDDKKSGLAHCSLINLDINGAYNAVRDADHESNMITNVKMSGIKCTNGRQTAFEMNDMWGFIFLLDTVVDYSGSSVDMNFPAIYLKDNAGFVATNVHIKGKAGVSSEKNDGWVTDNSVAVWFDQCTVADVGGCGFNLKNNPVYIYLLNCQIERASKHGLSMTGGADLQTQNLVVKDCGMDGLNMTCTLAQLNNTTIFGSGRNGVTISSARLVQFVNLKSDNNASFGVSDTSRDNSYTNVTGSGNGKGLTFIADENVVVTAG